ncbi:MAG: UPF0280 family protein [Promethearchaeia archaeon]
MRKYKHHFTEKESDVTIISDSKRAILRAKQAFFKHRKALEEFSSSHEEFVNSFSPVKVDSDLRIVMLMVEAAELTDVGPMASVAGALADLMLEDMNIENQIGQDIMYKLVENGGEIAIDTEDAMKVGLYAGRNRLNSNLGFLIQEKDCPLGMGTSSATIGHAVSLGVADAVTVFAETAAIADSAATRVANAVKGEDVEKSIKRGLDITDDLPKVFGSFISRGDKIGHTGNLPQFIRIEGSQDALIKDKVKNVFADEFEVFE